MRLDNDEKCQLLLAVHPVIVDALPAISQDSSVRLVNDNRIRLLRSEIKTISMTFSEEVANCKLSNEAFKEGCDSLDNLLCFYETLINNSILTRISHDLDQYDNKVCSLELFHLVGSADGLPLLSCRIFQSSWH